METVLHKNFNLTYYFFQIFIFVGDVVVFFGQYKTLFVNKTPGIFLHYLIVRQ